MTAKTDPQIIGHNPHQMLTLDMGDVQFFITERMLHSLHRQMTAWFTMIPAEFNYGIKVAKLEELNDKILQ